MTIAPEPITSTRLISVRLGIRYAVTKETTTFTTETTITTKKSHFTRRVRRRSHRVVVVSLLSPLLHRLEELAEQVVRIMGTGRCFRMVLHREDRLGGMPETFDGPVVQVQMGDGHV